MMAIEFYNPNTQLPDGVSTKAIVDKCLEKGLISFWFLSHPYSFRLSPPLTITEEEIRKAAQIILEAIEETAD